jgi:hypothetical protein
VSNFSVSKLRQRSHHFHAIFRTPVLWLRALEVRERLLDQAISKHFDLCVRPGRVRARKVVVPAVGSLLDGHGRWELQIEVGIAFAAHREFAGTFARGPNIASAISLIVSLPSLSFSISWPRDPAAGDPWEGVALVKSSIESLRCVI